MTSTDVWSCTGWSRALRASRAPYLVALVVGVTVSSYAQYLWQYVWTEMPLIKAQTPGIYVGAIGVLVTFIVWLFAPSRRCLGLQPRLFVGVLGTLWLIVMLLAVTHDDAFNHLVWLYPVVLLMLALKWPTAHEALQALVVLGWMLTAILVLTRLLELLGWIPMATVSAGMIAYERDNYWLPLAGWLGPEGRWPGPMGHNANTGNIAAYLIVFAVALKRRYATPTFVTVGVLTLLLTMSRGSFVAALVGLGVVLMLGDFPWTRRFTWRQRTVGVSIVGVLTFTGALLVTPNLTGRTDAYWPMFLDLWRASPWVGVGETGIEAGPEFIHDSNGHNIVIDMLARYGLAATIPLVVALAVALWLAIRSAARAAIIPLGVVTVFLVIGITEADIAWNAISIPWLFLVLATVLAVGVVDARPRVASGGPGSTEPAQGQ